MTRRRLLAVAGGGAAVALPACTGATPDGSPLVIQNDSVHNAFPSVVRLADGRLLLLYRKGTTHASSLDGVMIGRFSSDDGATWGSETTIVNPTEDMRDVCATVTPGGTVLATYTLADGDTLADDFFAYLIRSTDNAATWSSPIAIGTAFGTGGSHREVAGTPIVTLSDGRLLLPIAGRTSGQADTNESVIVVFSEDDGLTWGDPVTVVSVSGQFYTEPFVITTPSGLHMLIRRNDTGNIYRTTSSDDGATWSTPATAFSGRGKPAHALLDCGTILYVGRPNATGDTIYRTSTDYGASWSGETTLDTHLENNSYASLVRLGRTRMLSVYGCELVDGTNSDIRSQVFTAA